MYGVKRIVKVVGLTEGLDTQSPMILTRGFCMCMVDQKIRDGSVM